MDALKILRALIDLREGPLVQIKAPFEVKLVSLGIWGVLIGRTAAIRRREFHLNLLSDRLTQFVLQREKSTGFAVIVVRPQMYLILDPNQLSADASAPALPPDAALQNVIHSQFMPDLRDRLVGVFIGRRMTFARSRQAVPG